MPGPGFLAEFCISFKRLRCNGSWKRKAGANPMLKRRSVVGGCFSGLRSWVLPIHPEEAAVLYYILLPFVALHSREENDNIYIYVYFGGLH